jgi:hypothetical protein
MTPSWNVARSKRSARLSAAALIALLGCAGAGDGAGFHEGTPADGADTGPPPASAPAAADSGSSGPQPAPPPPAGAPAAPGTPPAERPVDAAGTWTAAGLRADRAVAGVATLRDVRTARNDGFDRIVLDFGGDPIPSWEVEYVDRPVRQCGSGDAVPVAGDAWLRIHVQPARGHSDAGQATVTDRRRSPRLPAVRELVMTCDFEAHVEWVAGVGAPNRFRVSELRDPTRLVVDIRH